MGLLFVLAILIILTFAVAGAVYQMTHPQRRTVAFALARGYPADPSEAGLKARTIEHTWPAGHRGTIWIVEGENSSGPTVVVVHGWSSSRFWSLSKATRFTPYASRVVLFDQRAHGDNTARRSTVGVKEPWDLAHLLDAIVSPEDSIVLYGSSMGAGVALRTAVWTASDAVKQAIVGLVLEGPYRKPDAPLANRLRQMRCPGWPIAPLAIQVLRWLIYDQTTRRFPEDLIDAAREFDRPLLVVHGACDPVCDPRDGRAISEAAGGDFLEVEGGDHGNLMEHAPQTYRRALEAFFKQLPTAARVSRQGQSAGEPASPDAPSRTNAFSRCATEG